MIIDPEFPQRKLRRFYVLCQSPSTSGKKDLVNWALLLFSTEVQQLAVFCDYNNPLRYTSHGKRQQGLSKCANHGVASVAMMLQLGGYPSHKQD